MADFKRGYLGLPFEIAGGGSIFNTVIDATGKKIAFIFAAETTETITTYLFRYGARTGTPPTYQVSLQTVDATTGFPTGTIVTGNGASNVSATFTPPASTAWDGTIQRITLGDTYTPTRGQMLAWVIEYSSGTIDASNNSSFTTGYSFCVSKNRPYVATNNGTSWSKTSFTSGFGYAGASRVYGAPVLLSSSTTVGTTEIGFQFTPDAAWGDTYKVRGLEMLFRMISASSVARMTLYDTDGTTVLQQVDIDSDILGLSGVGVVQIIFDEATLSTLTFGNTYSIGVQTASGSNVVMFWIQTDQAGDMEAFAGGQLFPFVSRATPGSGSWTVDSTKRILGGLIVSDWTEPAGGGGGTAGPTAIMMAMEG